MAEDRLQRINEKLRRELGLDVANALIDPDVVEIMLNEDGTLWIERLGESMEPLSHMEPYQAEGLIGTIASMMRTTVTRENPILECQLPIDGSRFQASIPPIVESPVFTIRRKASRIFTLSDYIRQGVMTEPEAQAIEEAIELHKNILIVGGTGSGKTTLANACIQHMVQANTQERLVILEDTPEIQCAAENKVQFRTSDTVDMQRLLRNTMRMRPDRIVVGEVRGGEALALLKAWNTGHPGGIATVHGNNARGGLIRLQQLIDEVSKTPMQLLIAEAVQMVVAIARKGGSRKIEEIVTVEGFDGVNYHVKSIKER